MNDKLKKKKTPLTNTRVAWLGLLRGRLMLKNMFAYLFSSSTVNIPSKFHF